MIILYFLIMDIYMKVKNSENFEQSLKEINY